MINQLTTLLPQLLLEDGINVNDYYWKSLPTHKVKAEIKFKTPGTVVAGLPYFFETLSFLEGTAVGNAFAAHEGKILAAPSEEITFELSFRSALTGERLALNMLQRACSIATITKKFVDKAKREEVAILETRKTTPGLRFLEKYAVRVGGGHNHRFTQTDAFMIKDNHKTCLGGLAGAWNFFKKMQSFYTPIIVEIHSLEELKHAITLGIHHIMLDNFTPQMLTEALQAKPQGMTYELSGGINLSNIDSYIVKGVDAISIGALTYDVPSVDISLKYRPL
ncbi:MAG: carboxylating nicotinate-nucleotide diphosphorylase [Oligoflexia bacterium]|nr:carboxylating nicotinate-nucleotide diphosphorylase [Oligoflexia bacterium]MBF0365984.1 carboxylating nicotinate-nucleotide diphosphorylase [Oligoflexia bacterium]